MKEIKAIVIGAAGKMGGRIIHIIKETSSMRLHRAIERPDHPLIGKDIGEKSPVWEQWASRWKED
jgi:4-hydroxy-tetrahydrodipicolinate reductase